VTEPRPAATVLLLRDGSAGFEVFMVRRHHLMGFAGGALVFPGGRIDETDRRLAQRPDIRAVLPGADETDLAFRLGALRETFEESGLLIARRAGRLADAARVQTMRQARADVAKGTLSFADLLTREGLTPAPDLLMAFAHWITPQGIFPKRYDTMFFLALVPAGQIAVHDGEELVDSCWISPRRALAGEAPGKLEFVTRRNLEKLCGAGTAAEAFERARASRIITVLPVVEDTPEGRRACLPADAGYGGPVFDFDR